MNKMYALMPRLLPQALMRPMIGKHLLSHLAWAYGGFGESALASMELPNRVFRTQKAGVSGSVEAFVGALLQDTPDGLHLVVRWFRAMMTSGALPTVRPDAEKHITDEVLRRDEILRRDGRKLLIDEVE